MAASKSEITVRLLALPARERHALLREALREMARKCEADGIEVEFELEGDAYEQ